MKILVCIDDSPESHKALQRAVELGNSERDEFFIVSVAEPNYADPIVDAVLRLERQQLEISFHKTILDKAIELVKAGGFENTSGEVLAGSSPKDLLLKTLNADNAIELCVLGHRHHGLFERLFSGSVADYMVKNAPCDILLVRQSRVPTQE